MAPEISPLVVVEPVGVLGQLSRYLVEGASARGLNVIGMTGSVTKALYLDSDGFDRTLRLGEDMHLGHSLAQAGGVFVVDREARSWHLGRSQVLRRA